VFNTIPPQATFGPGFSSFWATAINWSGAVVGYFTGDSPFESGFVAHPDGYFGQFIVPQTLYCDIGQATIPEGINAGGTIAGWYTNCNPENNLGGFVMSPDGNLTLFKPAGTILTSALPQTTPYAQPQDPPYLESLTAPRVLSIDQAGDITGSYTDAAGVQHGFVRNPYGTITTFDPPENAARVGTQPTSINDAGVITGFYGRAGETGFLRVPLTGTSTQQ
jgi:hypothetical protein